MESALVYDSFLCLLNAEQLLLFHFPNHNFLINTEHFYLLLTGLIWKESLLTFYYCPELLATVK